MSKERKNNTVILAPHSYVAAHRKQPNVARQDMRKEDEGNAKSNNIRWRYKNWCIQIR